MSDEAEGFLAAAGAGAGAVAGGAAVFGAGAAATAAVAGFGLERWKRLPATGGLAGLGAVALGALALGATSTTAATGMADAVATGAAVWGGFGAISGAGGAGTTEAVTEFDSMLAGGSVTPASPESERCASRSTR